MHGRLRANGDELKRVEYFVSRSAVAARDDNNCRSTLPFPGLLEKRELTRWRRERERQRAREKILDSKELPLDNARHHVLPQCDKPPFSRAPSRVHEAARDSLAHLRIGSLSGPADAASGSRRRRPRCPRRSTRT